MELAAGDYYAKELSAGKWFFVDGSVYEFSIEAENASDMEFKDMPINPKISTTATDADTCGHNLSFKDKVTIKDVVSYEGLVPGEEYVITGTLHDARNGEIYYDYDGNTYTGTVRFTPDDSNSDIVNGVSSGEITVVFDNVVIPADKITLVVFERLYKDDLLIASHEDANDKDQTVKRLAPEIGTTATDAVNGTHFFTYEETVSLKDEVRYANLNPGETYYLTGTLYDADTGKMYTDEKGNTYKETVEFTALETYGTENVVFDDVLVPLSETTIVVFEELYEKTTDNLIAVHADLKDKGQTVKRPEIHTKAADAENGSHTLTLKEKVTIRDSVTYTGLIPGVAYTVTGTLFNAETGEIYTDSKGCTYTKSIVFTADRSDGEEVIVFKDVLVPFEKTTIVVFEDLYEKSTGVLIATHADLSDDDQSVRRPEIRTTAVDADTGTHFSSYKEKVAINDNVVYENLTAGEEYVITGTLYDADTGNVYKDSEGKSYSRSVLFKPEDNDGQVIVPFEDVEVPADGKTVVVFERLYKNGNDALVAVHEDINYKGQSVERRVPGISTTAADADTGTHFLSYRERVSVTDNVAYTNLNVGEEYVVTGTLYNADTGEVYKDAEGNIYSKSVVFKPLTSDGNVEVLFTDVLVPFEKTVLVVFEDLYESETNNKIAVHADLNDKDQTVERRVPDIHTTATDAGTGTHILSYEEKVTITDVVSYTNLNAGETYCFTGTLYDAGTGKIYTDREGKKYITTVEFTAAEADGEVTVEFKDVLVPLEKTTIVVFEDLYEITTGTLIAAHADLNDKYQTVIRPSVGTVATVLNAKEIWLGTTEVTDITISDVIAYSGFEAGRTYRAEATICKSDGSQIMSEGKPVMSVVSFVPSESDGEIKVDITFTTDGLAEGDRIVVFEKIYDVAKEDEISSAARAGDILIAAHEDLSDEDQTITIHFRPMTGGIVPSYSVAGNVIATISSVAAGIWFFVSRRKRYNGT